MAELADSILRHEARTLTIPLRQLQAVIELLDEGFSVPFIARYRKDQTGALDIATIRKVQRQLAKLAQLNERKKTILRDLESQGVLTDQLKGKIESTATSKRLEDIYLPYNPQKQASALEAIEKGLKPLADAILSATQPGDLESLALPFVSEEKGVATVQDALAGAANIIAQQLSESFDFRQLLRDYIQRSGKIVSTQIENAQPASDESAAPAEENSPAEENVSTEESAPAVDAVPESEPEQPTSDEATEPVQDENPSEESEDAAETDSADDSASDVAEIDVAFALAKGALADKDQVVVSKKATKRLHKAELHARELAAAGDTAALQEEIDAQKKNDKKAPKDNKNNKAFEEFFNYSEDIHKIQPTKVLALNRGQRAKVLNVSLDFDVQAVKQKAIEKLLPETSPYTEFLSSCLEEAIGFAKPSLETEIRKDLLERAEINTIDVIAKTVSNQLLQRPVRNLRVLAISPGFKNGCKLVALDQFGNFIDRKVIYVIGKKSKAEQCKKQIAEMVKRNGVSVIAIGNGPACREMETFISSLIETDESMKDVSYILINESGAGVYAGSVLGREEFPELDPSVRCAISIGRRLLDPLAELVKVDPVNYCIGSHQYDVKPKSLKHALENVVENCVNEVGVNLNQASASLLRNVSGLNALLAGRICDYRRKNGPFKNRQQLLEVPGITEKAYAQAAGFLKVAKSTEPLDETWIHPESYDVAKTLLAKLGFTSDDLKDSSKSEDIKNAVAQADVAALATELNIGEYALKDILAQFVNPGADVRETFPEPTFKKGSVKLDDLSEGQHLKGVVLNVVEFGAFIDIGMSDSGLVHVSELADKYVHDPHEVVSVGDNVDAWVVSVDKDRHRVSLTLIDPSKPRNVTQRREPRGGNREGAAASGEGRANRERRKFTPKREPRGEKQDRREPRDQNREQKNDNRESNSERRPRSSRWNREPQQREFISKAQVEPKQSTLTEKQKSGKEPIRSFGDLAQLFKLSQNNDDENNEKK